STSHQIGKAISTLEVFFFSSRRRHTRFSRDWSSDVCSSDLASPIRLVCPRPKGTAGRDPGPLRGEVTMTTATAQKVRIRIPQWFMERHELVSRELDGEVIARTSRAILFRGKAVVRESRFCLRCDREITNPASILVGYGPECARKLLKYHPGHLDPTNAEAVRRALEQMGDVEIWIPLSVGQIIEGDLGDMAASKSASKPAPPPNLRIELVDGELALTCPYEDREKAKHLHGRWHKATKT